MAAADFWTLLYNTIEFNFLSLMVLLGVDVVCDVIWFVESDVVVCGVGVDEERAIFLLVHSSMFWMQACTAFLRSLS